MERVKSVDVWINKLSPYEIQNLSRNTTNQYIIIAWLLQQHLPRIEIRTFNRSPLKWVELVIVKLCIIMITWTIHRKYITYSNNVSGIAKRAILHVSNDERGHIFSLKRLKFKFVEKSRITEAHLTKVTKSKQIANDDDKALIEFYY